MAVLIVDDSATMRRIVKKIVADIGFDSFLEAGDGEEALEVVEKNGSEIELVLLDWNMPKKNGLDFLREFRQISHLNHVPVVMVTTEAEKSQIITAIKCGAQNYIVKPFTPATFKEKLEAIFGEKIDDETVDTNAEKGADESQADYENRMQRVRDLSGKRKARLKALMKKRMQSL